MDNETKRLIRKALILISRLQRDVNAISHKKSPDRQTQQPPIIIPSEISLAPPVSDYYAAEQKERESKSQRDKHRLTIEKVTLVAAIAAAIFTGFTLCQLWKQTGIEERSFEAAQKAYISVTGLVVEPVPDSPKFWRVLPVANNSGNTPTKNLWWTSVAGDYSGYVHAINQTVTPSPPPHTLRDFEGRTRNAFSIGPHQELRALGMAFPIPVEIIDGIKAHKTEAKFTGALFYQDFVSSKLHVTLYCFNLWHSPSVTGEKAIAFSPCYGNYNCIDEECSDYNQLKTLAIPAK
jgi:hypothetical protein